MTDTSFDSYVKELEARCTDDERAMLDRARDMARAQFANVERQIKRRERIDAFVAKMVAKYGENNVILHQWPDSPFNHDGPCVEITPHNCGGMYFTTLLLKAEVWGSYASGTRVTPDPLPVWGEDDNETVLNIMRYIDGWISMHLLKEED